VSTLDFSIVLSRGSGGADLTWTSRPWLHRGEDLYVTVGVDERPDAAVPMLSVQATPADMRAFAQRFIAAADQAEAAEEALRAEAEAAATAAQEAQS